MTVINKLADWTTLHSAFTARAAADQVMQARTPACLILGCEVRERQNCSTTEQQIMAAVLNRGAAGARQTCSTEEAVAMLNQRADLIAIAICRGPRQIHSPKEQL